MYRHSLISHNLTFPPSLPTANQPPSLEIATLLTLPSGVLSVGQFLYTVQLGRCTSLSAFFFQREDITSIWLSGEKTRWEMGVVRWERVFVGVGRLLPALVEAGLLVAFSLKMAEKAGERRS